MLYNIPGLHEDVFYGVFMIVLHANSYDVFLVYIPSFSSIPLVCMHVILQK